MDTRIKIAVYRAREANCPLQDLISTEGLPTPLHTTVDGMECTLWTTEHTGQRPAWVDVFADIFGVNAAQLLPEPPRSISGLAFISGRHGSFAITFGHGWQRVKRDSTDPNFGVRCVLNLCQDTSLRAIRRDRMTSELVQVIEQSPEETGIYRFGIDTEADMLRGVKATIDPALNFGSGISGSDSFHCSWDPASMSLERLLQSLVTLAKATTYRAKFEWIDYIIPVLDKAEITALDGAAITDINQASPKFRLNPPQFSQWDGFDYFIFGRRRSSPIKDELSIQSWLHHMRRRSANKSSPITLTAIKEESVYAIDEMNPGKSARWKVYDCLYGIVLYGHSTYMLHESNWYRLSMDYIAKVDRSLADISDLSGSGKLMPSLPNEREDAYNRRVVRQSNRRIQLFDRKIIHHGGGRSKFEFCDLLSDDMVIYCVKRWASSSGISHLARQAVNTCKLLRGDADFVRKIERRLKGVRRSNWLQVKDRSIRPTIALVIMGASSLSQVPFFSRMTLGDAARQIRMLGFDVVFDWV